MPKRKHECSKEDKWKKKIYKYEKKLRQRRYRSRSSSSEDSHRREDSDMYSPSPPATLGPGLHSTVSWMQPTRSEQGSSQQRSRTPSPSRSLPMMKAVPPDPPGVVLSEESSNLVDPELLLALGECEEAAEEWGDDVLKEFSERLNPILRDGLSKEIKDTLLKKILYPKNMIYMKAPVLNPEISAILTEPARNRDSRVVSKQSQIGCVLTTLVRTMHMMLNHTINTADVVRNLNDASKLRADSHYRETETRRSLITPMLEKSFLDPIKDRKRDIFLFGENLGEFIKNSRGFQKTGDLIKSTNPLNWKGPPPQHQGRTSLRTRYNRGGGGVSRARAQRTAPQPPSRRFAPQPAAAPRAPYNNAPAPPPPPPRYRHPPATRQPRHK